MLFEQGNLTSFLLVQEELKINWWHPWHAFSPFLQAALDHYLSDGSFGDAHAVLSFHVHVVMDVLSFLFIACRMTNHWYRIKMQPIYVSVLA